MPSHLKFKKSTLCLSISSVIGKKYHKYLCLSVFLGFLAQTGYAKSEQILTLPKNSDSNISATEQQQSIKATAENQGLATSENLEKIEQLDQEYNGPDSVDMLNEQMNSAQSIEEFKPIDLEDLEDLPIDPVNDQMVNEIFAVAEQAKKDAEKYRAEQSQEIVVKDASQQELSEINQAPVNIDNLMSTIESDSKIVVEANETGKTLAEVGLKPEEPTVTEKPGFFKRVYNRVRPKRAVNMAKIERISAEVVIASDIPDTENASQKQAYANLKENIKAKLSSYTVEAFDDYTSAVPQLRNLSTQAAQAVGFYNAEFKFEKIADGKVRVNVVPNEPVLVKSQNVEFTGPGQQLSQFQVISVLPDLNEKDVFNHGLYDKTKTRITDAASNYGFFDSYWRLHDVKIMQPQNTADINLKFETGERYKLGSVEFRMSDPNKEFPLDMDILEKLVTWKDGQDYAFWRVNSLANNLTNSRYFNYTLVDAFRPDPIEKTLELAPDIQALLDEENRANTAIINKNSVKKVDPSSTEVTQNVVDEKAFAGTQEEQEENAQLENLAEKDRKRLLESERLKAQAREEKKVPVIVTLNADKLNSAEVGLGYGTDTGARLRSQYRRAIVNKRGHSFDANFELSEIRQSIDARYNIPYKHPLNDYFSLVGGYEREDRNDVSDSGDLLIESAVIGADRIIKNPRGSWQHIMGVRYRLDRLTGQGTFDADDIPDEFLGNGNSEQESLLFGYEISRIDSNTRVNPTKGFKQIYKAEVGSKNLLTDVNMARINAGWRFIYSLGENFDHQFVGRADLGYIFTDDFNLVPYNLRYFAGGDQSIRGFDYKSLTPEEDGFKIGGQALAVGSIEYNYQFKEGWRAAIFTDFGNAYDADFKEPTAYGVGVGIRWASPIGPIRLDVASGISDDNKPIRLHFFIGPPL